MWRSWTGRRRLHDRAGHRSGHIRHQGHRRGPRSKGSAAWPRYRCTRATSTVAGSSRIRPNCSTRCWRRAARPSTRRAGPSTWCRWPTRARPFWRGIRDTGRPLTQAIVWQDRRAEALCAETGRARASRSPRAPDWCSTRTSRRRRWRGCGATSRPAAVVTTSDTWLLHQLTRRVRHRRHHRQPVAGDRPGQRRVEPGPVGAVRTRRRGHARHRRQRRRHRYDDGFRRRGPRRRYRRRPAGRAAGRGMLRRGNGQVHLRHRGVPARQHRQRPPVRSHLRTDLVGGLARRRRGHLLRRRAGLHRGLGGALAGLARHHHAAPRNSTRSPPPTCQGRAVRARPGRTGRAVVGIAVPPQRFRV